MAAYKWKTGFWKVPAEVAGNEFEKLEQSVGLTAENVVAVSRPKNAPLHSCFEWDDAVAGELYRKQQASVMIAALTVSVESSSGEQLETRAFVTLTSRGEKGTFESVAAVLNDTEKTTALLDRAKKDAAIFRDKYSTLKECSGIIKQITAFIGE